MTTLAEEGIRHMASVELSNREQIKAGHKNPDPRRPNHGIQFDHRRQIEHMLKEFEQQWIVNDHALAVRGKKSRRLRKIVADEPCGDGKNIPRDRPCNAN